MACPVCKTPVTSGAACPKCEPTPAFRSKLAVASPAAPASQTLLAGRYRLEEPIGQGGMGEVFRAHDTRLDRRVAVKRLRTLWHGEPEILARFHSEVKNTVRVEHPNVVDVLDKGDDDAGHPFFVLEYLEGKSLRAVLETEPVMSVERALRLIDQALRGLGKAHRLRVVHRDLKPDNIMLVDDGAGGEFVKLLDFGIAKALDSATAHVTESGRIMGTPAYMAPEAAGGRGANHPTVDVFAIGVLLFEMLSGTIPIEDEAPREAGSEPPRVRERRSEVSEALDAVVAKAMAPSPRDRFQSADEFREALFGVRSSDVTIELGTKIDGYRLGRQIGEGAWSVVYEATDARIGRTCALKFLRFDDGDEAAPLRRQRFFQDAALAAQIEHQNVVKVFSVGEWQGRPYLALERVDGKTLAESMPTLAWPAVVGIVRQLAGALAAVHAAGIVHRDVKPDNVVIDSRGVPKLLDFGVARTTISRLTESSIGEMIGTYGYKAPEQAWDPRTTTPLSDQWSLAAIVYEIVTGECPYCEPDDGEGSAHDDAVAGRLLSKEPPKDPRAWNPTVHDDLAKVLLRALSFDPTARFKSVDEFAQGLAATRVKGLELPLFEGVQLKPRRLSPKFAWLLLPAAAAAVAGVASLTNSPSKTTRVTPASVLPPAMPAVSVPAPVMATLELNSNAAGAVLLVEGQRIILPTKLERTLGTRLNARVERERYEPQDVMLDFAAPNRMLRFDLKLRAVSVEKRRRTPIPSDYDRDLYLEPSRSDSVVTDPGKSQ